MSDTGFGGHGLRSEIVRLEGALDGDVLARVTAELEQLSIGHAVLRWGLVGVNGSSVILEVCRITAASAANAQPRSSGGGSGRVPCSVALVIPTGVGASIGGHIGDGGPIAKVLEHATDFVITHPNVVNGADFYGAERSLYVDGYTLDQFFAGAVRLRPPKRAKRIGLLLDCMPEREVRLLVNAAEAARAVWGTEVVGYAICKSPARARVALSPQKHFIGAIENPDVLLESALRLIDCGAEAIAVVTAVGGVSPEHWQAHYSGDAPNPVGALEALISRAITWKTGVPCAHAPAFLPDVTQANYKIDARAAAEVVSRTGLPCVLRGLAMSPDVDNGGIGVSELTAIVVPYNCAGGCPALASSRFGIPLIAVRANDCKVGITADVLRLKHAQTVASYAEAVGFVAALRAGVAWESINSLTALRMI
jgi:hypothetical protein